MKLQTLKPKLSQHTPRQMRTVQGPGVASRKRFYNSARWRTEAQPAKLRRDPCCQACAFEGFAEPAVHVDHWVSLEKGGHPTSDDNLVSLCISHHSRKTRSEMEGKPVPFEIVASTPRTYGVGIRGGRAGGGRQAAESKALNERAATHLGIQIPVGRFK